MTLIVNACEAMRGEGCLSLSTSTSDNSVEAEIRDTGPGINSSKLDNLFDLQFSTHQNRVGMGLGLPTADRIARKHGGSLTVRTTTGGTTFTLRLPTDAAALSTARG